MYLATFWGLSFIKILGKYFPSFFDHGTNAEKNDLLLKGVEPKLLA